MPAFRMLVAAPSRLYRFACSIVGPMRAQIQIVLYLTRSTSTNYMALDPSVFYKVGKRILIKDGIPDNCPKTLQKYMKKGSVWARHGEQLAAQSKGESASARQSSHEHEGYCAWWCADLGNSRWRWRRSKSHSKMKTGWKVASQTDLQRLKSDVTNPS